MNILVISIPNRDWNSNYLPFYTSEPWNNFENHKSLDSMIPASCLVPTQWLDQYYGDLKPSQATVPFLTCDPGIARFQVAVLIRLILKEPWWRCI